MHPEDATFIVGSKDKQNLDQIHIVCIRTILKLRLQQGGEGVMK